MAQPQVLKDLHWYGHDSFRIDRPVVIYIDPWRLPPSSPPADVVLVTHDHHDHCSAEDLGRIRQAGTVLIANPSAAAKMPAPVTVLKPGERTRAGGIEIEATPAYNLDKPFHPKRALGIGFMLTIGGEKLYHAGDTDHIPEMQGLACDVALLPVSGVYTMTAEEAAQAAEVIRPKVAVPMHYGAGVAGSPDDAERFRRLASVPVEVLVQETG